MKKQLNSKMIQAMLGQRAFTAVAGGILSLMSHCAWIAPEKVDNQKSVLESLLLGVGADAALNQTPGMVSSSVSLSAAPACLPIGNISNVTVTDPLNGDGNDEYRVTFNVYQAGTTTPLSSSFYIAYPKPLSAFSVSTSMFSNWSSFNGNGNAEEIEIVVNKFNKGINVDPADQTRIWKTGVPRQLGEKVALGVANTTFSNLSGPHNILMSNSVNGTIPYDANASTTFDVATNATGSLFNITRNGTGLIQQISINDIRCLSTYDTGLAVNTNYSSIDLSTGPKEFIVIADQNVSGNKHVSLMRVTYVSSGVYNIDVETVTTAVPIGNGLLVDFLRGF